MLWQNLSLLSMGLSCRSLRFCLRQLEYDQSPDISCASSKREEKSWLISPLEVYSAKLFILYDIHLNKELILSWDLVLLIITINVLDWYQRGPLHRDKC